MPWCRLLCRGWRQPLWCTTRRRAVTYPECDVKEARPAVVRSYIMESGEEALEALSNTQRQRWVSRRIIGHWRDAARQHNILWLRRRLSGISHPPYSALVASDQLPVRRPPCSSTNPGPAATIRAGWPQRSLGRRGVSATRFCAAPGGRAM
jgi:hypothetical protein